ncbi:hypothetical protein BDR05DRAFT_954829 [Suillus weaverae]|nr:hypothetical protein BDR05DRAFT_954829 [Suillus weaverae]
MFAEKDYIFSTGKTLYAISACSQIPEQYKLELLMTQSGFCVNPLEYLPWLRLELESRGVTSPRQYARSLDEVKPFVGKTG